MSDTQQTTKKFDLTKYIHKDLENYNRITVYFNHKKAQHDTLTEKIIDIILQVKTLYGVNNILTITTNKTYINIYENYFKKVQKSAYIKQNRGCILRVHGQHKSNLFGWSDQEDGDVLDKYMSQQNIEKYQHNIVDVHDFSLSEMPEVNLVKEMIRLVAHASNLCKDTYLSESYVEYKLNLDAVTCFIIREYIDDSKINIMLVTEMNEEKKILPDKLTKFVDYISNINYIVNNTVDIV